MQQLFELSSQGADADSWLTGAESSTVFLKDNARAEKVVLYASLPHVLIHGVLAPLKQLKTPDQSELGHGFVAPDTGWHIEHVSGGGRPDRVYLAPPLSPDSTNLKGGEKLIFRRHWPGAEHPTTEISQKLVHALALHYVEERDAYCRIDEHGDLEDVIRIFDRPSEQPGESVLVITIKHQDFYEYAVLARMGVVFFFDFTRYRPGFFSDWSNQQRFESHNTHLFYEGGVKPGTGSYVNGRQIVLPPVTKRDIVRRYKQLRNPKKENYSVFKALDLKTQKHIETSCDPSKLSNYFQPESRLPLQMSPVFFRAEVIQKYKSDSAKYELTDWSILCRGAWHLQTYHYNDAGQVHTYIRYLGYLPYQEQLYWQSFNEWPKGPLSRRAIFNDFMGKISPDYDSLYAVKNKVERLDGSPPGWWDPRGRKLSRLVHYPITDSNEEWSNAILLFDQLLIEGFNHRSLKEIATKMGRPLRSDWRSLKLMEECLIGKGVMEDHATAAIGALRKVHDLRTILKGHAAPHKKADKAKQALKDHGSFRFHFEALAADCDDALGLIMASMGFNEE